VVPVVKRLEGEEQVGVGQKERAVAARQKRLEVTGCLKVATVLEAVALIDSR
jgi:hypothetical protein